MNNQSKILKFGLNMNNIRPKSILNLRKLGNLKDIYMLI